MAKCQQKFSILIESEHHRYVVPKYLSIVNHILIVYVNVNLIKTGNREVRVEQTTRLLYADLSVSLNTQILLNYTYIISRSIKTNLFLPRIALDFMHIRDALRNSFLYPLVHLVFVLIEPVPAIDIAPGERWRNRLSQKFPYLRIICPLRVPPDRIQRIACIASPCWTNLLM